MQLRGRTFPLDGLRADNPAPNYGFYLDPGNYPRHAGEAGTILQPALFLDYVPVPEPGALTLLGAGWLLAGRNRRKTR